MVNIKEDTIIKCGIDGKMLKLVSGKYSLYYRCPNYEFAERGAGKPVCMNRLSFRDRDMLYSELQKLMDEGKLVAGTNGRRLHLAYEVEEVDEGYVSVYVINTAKIKLFDGGYKWG